VERRRVRRGRNGTDPTVGEIFKRGGRKRGVGRLGLRGRNKKTGVEKTGDGEKWGITRPKR